MVTVVSCFVMNYLVIKVSECYPALLPENLDTLFCLHPNSARGWSLPGWSARPALVKRASCCVPKAPLSWNTPASLPALHWQALPSLPKAHLSEFPSWIFYSVCLMFPSTYSNHFGLKTLEPGWVNIHLYLFCFPSEYLCIVTFSPFLSKGQGTSKSVSM